MSKFFNKKKRSKETNFEEKVQASGKVLNSENIKCLLSDSSDINYQIYYINGNRNLPVTVVFVDGLVNTKSVSDDILKPLAQEKTLSEGKSFNDIIELIEHGTVYHYSRKVQTKLEETIADILDGSVALIFDEENKAITFDVKGYEKRNITEPTTENVLKGAKESFIEVLRVNTSLVRRKIHSHNIRIRETIVGQQTQTHVAVIYIENLTNKNLVEEVLKRLNAINIDGAITAGSIEEYIIDNQFTIFPQVMTTERTDKFCSNILDGRVGLLIDGLPTAYIIPGVLNMFFQAPEDYAQNYFLSSLNRLLRYVSAGVTLILPAFYVAITAFHHEMIPTDLAVSIIQSKMGVPFPSFTEVFVMMLAFEVLLEAGLRLPKTIGQAVSIIGALVIGEAAVQARLVSPAVVIVVASTGITGFTMPNQDFANALRICRLLFVICATIAGLYGVSLAFLVLLYHLSKLETFGVPYFSPFVANEGQELTKDTLLRLPLYLTKKRPKSLKTTNKQRQE